MASLELNAKSKQYHIRFRFCKREFKRSLKTSDVKQARAALARLEETISLVHRGVLELPKTVDPIQFFLTGGRNGTANGQQNLMTLRQLFDNYGKCLPEHAKEQSTVETERIHLRHFRQHLPTAKPVVAITTNDVQNYVNKQLSKRVRGRLIKPDTVKRQIATLRFIFNWGRRQQLFDCAAPTSGIVYPKRDEKPLFRTRSEIQRIIARGGLDDEQQRALWDSLYLTKDEVKQVLAFIKENAKYPFVYPMFAFVAYTGARRSEMLRSRIDDFDLELGSVVIRERKRVRSRSTTFRHVEMPSFLVDVVHKWFSHHPGGQFTFCHDFGVVKREQIAGLTRDQARTQFKKALRGSGWTAIKGFHVFRHSYASNLAASGVDQRIIDMHMGHQTAEMSRRYQHLRPAIRKIAVEALLT